MLTLIEKFKTFFKGEIKKPLTEYETHLALVDKLNSDRFLNFNNKDNSTINVRTIHPKITTYIHKLKEINSYLVRDLVVYAGWCDLPERRLPINGFFLDEKDYYINERKNVEEFKMLTIVFLSYYYERSPEKEAGEHNTRVLFYFKNSLLNTIEDLTNLI